MTTQIGAGAMHTLHWLAEHPDLHPHTDIAHGIGHATTAALRRHLDRLEALELVETDEIQGETGHWRAAAIITEAGTELASLGLRILTPTVSRMTTALLDYDTRDALADGLDRPAQVVKRDLEVVRDAGLASRTGRRWSLTDRGQKLARLLCEMPQAAPPAESRVLLPSQWARVLEMCADGGGAYTETEIGRVLQIGRQQRRRTLGRLMDADLLASQVDRFHTRGVQKWRITARGRRLIHALPTDPENAPRVSRRQMQACLAVHGGAHTRSAIATVTGWASSTDWQMLQSCIRAGLMGRRPVPDASIWEPQHRYHLTDWGRAVVTVLGPVVAMEAA